MTDLLLPFPDAYARTRGSDPSTSLEAAESQREVNIRATHSALLRLMAEVPDATDEEIADAYALAVEAGQAPLHTPSGLRHRRGELVAAGLLRDTGEKRANVSGRRAAVWALA